MGTFATIFIDKDGFIPESKKEEFSKRIEILYQLGGMMHLERIELYGKEILMFRKVRMNERGMNFSYNYFEDDYWENAGFSKKDCHVWSNKIGWNHFHEVVIAAYVLEELYTNGITITLVNGRLVTSWRYVGWINYLFDEKFHIKNFDPWKLFETFYYNETEKFEYENMTWFNFGDTRYAFIGGCEIYAVLNDTKEAIEVFERKEKGEYEIFALNSIKAMLEHLKQYAMSCTASKEEQLQQLMNTIESYYKVSDNDKFDFSNLDENLKQIMIGLRLSDAPAFIIKAIAELYDKDFLDLWSKLRNIIKRKFTKLYGNEGFYILPILTQDFLRVSSDDMIYYWKEDGKFEFSEQLWNWFQDLKSKFESMMNTEFSIEKPVEYIVGLMEEANETYYRIYPFADFFEETLENIADKRYQTLWKLYDEMIHDTELKKAGDVIFVPEGPEYEKVGLHYLGEQPKRRLMMSWDIMESAKKNNKARVTFRRYMALVANKELRCKVFGF